MCFVRECCTGFLVIQIELVSSHFNGIPLRSTPRSRRYCTIRKIWEQHALTAIYTTFVLDKATGFCYLEYHEINDDPKN